MTTRTTDTTILRMFAITATATRARFGTLTKDECIYAAFDAYCCSINQHRLKDRTPLGFMRDCYAARGLDSDELPTFPSQAGIARAWKVAIESGIIREAGRIRLRSGHSQKVYRFNDRAEIPSR